MADKQDEILTKIGDLRVICAAIDERTEGHTERLNTINGHVTDHTKQIATLEAETASQEKDLDQLKSQARKFGGSAGAAAGGFLAVLVTVAKHLIWPAN